MVLYGLLDIIEPQVTKCGFTGRTMTTRYGDYRLLGPKTSFHHQLYVCRRTLLQDGVPDCWTTFKMPLREPGPMPPLLDLMRFLASSITFTVNLRAVVVFFDGHRVGYINKIPEPAQPINVPTEMKRSSPKNIMHVREVQCHSECAHAIVCTT